MNPDISRTVIERAITARRPQARYLAGASAPLLLKTRRLLPQRAWEALVRTQYPQPVGA